MEDADRDLTPEPDVRTRSPSTPVTEVPMPVNIAEIIAAQNAHDFCQTVFATNSQTKSFFFERGGGGIVCFAVDNLRHGNLNRS